MPDQRTIKILFLIDELLPAGTEKQVIALAEGLPRDAFSPVIGVLQGNDYLQHLTLKTPVVNFRRCGVSLVKSLRLIRELQSHLRQERYDIVQTHLIDAAVLGSVAVQLTRPRPLLIGTRRNIYHWVHEYRRSFWLYRHTAQWADSILANSQSAADLCVKLEHIEPKRIRVIHNGVDLDRFQTISPEHGKALLGLKGKSPIIGVTGNWRPVKGLEVFLRAAARVHGRVPTAHFVLLGSGPLKKELQLLAEHLAIASHITFIEGRSDIHQLVSGLDIAVQPSLSESFSNVLVEYMAAGRPIVATKVGDAEQMIDEGKEGLLVSPHDDEAMSKAILELCEQPSMASEMGRRAAEKATANWAWTRIIETHQTLYETLLRQNAGYV
ncbi:MAG TPA: glycosyltransferase [Nitrospira sp.]|nr:glycosyltransferase [Nitrospira sp.]